MKLINSALVCFFSMMALACRREPSPPFQFEGPQTASPTDRGGNLNLRPVLSVEAPIKGAKFRRAERIPCRARMVLPAGGKMPMAIEFRLMRDGSRYDSGWGGPADAKEDLYWVNGSLGNPSKPPGRYTVVAVAIDDVVAEHPEPGGTLRGTAPPVVTRVEPPGKGPDTAPKRPTAIFTESPAIEVEVVP